ncbi:MAG: hypothetical protein ACREQ5_23570 [Candidatus Dormibacteria bacterium]
MLEILPDSRLRERAKGIIRGFFRGVGFINWMPIYCANCGKPNGYAPEENCTFVFWLCDPCSIKWGSSAGTALIPDEIFWQKAKYEQLEKYGRELSLTELLSVAESMTTPLSKLFRDHK